jgi:hypothetical protein
MQAPSFQQISCDSICLPTLPKHSAVQKKDYPVVKCTNYELIYLSITPDREYLDNLSAQKYFYNTDITGGYGDYQLEKYSIEKTASRLLKK